MRGPATTLLRCPAVLLVGALCTCACGGGSSSAATTEVERVLAAVLDRFQSGDAEGLMEQYAEDAVWMMRKPAHHDAPARRRRDLADPLGYLQLTVTKATGAADRLRLAFAKRVRLVIIA